MLFLEKVTKNEIHLSLTPKITQDNFCLYSLTLEDQPLPPVSHSGWTIPTCRTETSPSITKN